MKANELLANVKVASPCSARWSDMDGDERARFCAQCQKHVYNLSSLSADDAIALLRAKEGRLCARFYRRADGTILTADCPVGAAQVWPRFRRLAAAAAALVLFGIAAPLIAKSSTRNEQPRPRARVYRAWDDALVTIKTWLGYPPPRRMVMGEICIPAPPPKPPGNTTPQPTPANAR
jgi:hypothetical protein